MVYLKHRLLSMESSVFYMELMHYLFYFIFLANLHLPEEHCTNKTYTLKGWTLNQRIKVVFIVCFMKSNTCGVNNGDDKQMA